MTSTQRQNVALELPIYIQRNAEPADPLYMRQLLLNVVVKVSDTDAVSAVFTWHQAKSSIPRLPHLQFTTIDAPRRPNMEFYMPSDPFERPIILFVTHRTPNGAPFVISLAIYLFEWQGSIIVDSDIQQILFRNRRTTDPIQLFFPADSCHNDGDEQEQPAMTQEISSASFNT